jgi:hypothetical protein
MDQASEVAQQALALSTGKEIERFARRKLKEIVPEIAIDLE